MSRKRRLLAAVFGLALAGALSTPVLAGGHGNGLVPSTWDCGSAGTRVFLTPPVTNFHAPFPGFLSPTGQIYVVAAAGPYGGPLTYYGQKVGLVSGGTWTCSIVGVATVIVAPTR